MQTRLQAIFEGGGKLRGIPQHNRLRRPIAPSSHPRRVSRKAPRHTARKSLGVSLAAAEVAVRTEGLLVALVAAAVIQESWVAVVAA